MSSADLLKAASSCNPHSNPRSYGASILQCRIRRLARGSCGQGGGRKQTGRVEGRDRAKISTGDPELGRFLTPGLRSETLKAGFGVSGHSFPAHSGPSCPLWRSFVFSSCSPSFPLSHIQEADLQTLLVSPCQMAAGWELP